MNRLERLLNLVAALIAAERPLTRREIVERVPGYEGERAAARRSFERDKDTLRTMGIPITLEFLDEAYPELGEGYRIHAEEYRLPDPGLTADELAALHMAATTVRVEGGTFTEAFWKLGGAPGEPAAPDAGAAPTAAVPGSEHLPAMFQAVSERRRLSFRYRGGDREVDPYRLACRNGFWYLSAFDHGRGQERQFRLDRLESPPVVGAPQSFTRPPRDDERPMHPWEMGDDEPLEGLLLVDAIQAAWTVTRVGRASVVEERPDGSVVLRMRVTSREGFRTFALGLLDHAEVLGSPELRDDITQWLMGMAP